MAYFYSIFILLSLFISNLAFELSEEKINILNEMIERQMKEAKIETLGLIITNKKSTVYQNIYNGNEKINEATPFVIGSVSKSFTALGILKLNIDLKKTIDNYDLDEYISKENGKSITIAELLNHTSGLDSFSSKINKERKGKMTYSNYGYSLLGKIIQLESKKKYDEYIKEKIFSPLNMTNADAKYHEGIADSYDNFFGFNTKYTDLKSEIGDGFHVPAGFISASIEDMGKYLRYFLNTDSDDYRNYISQMIKGSVNYEYNIDYGMGMFIQKKNNEKLYFHPGDTSSFSSYLSIFPDLDLGIFAVINSNNIFCSTPKEDFFNSIQSFIAFDTMGYVHSNLFFYVHFSLDFIYIIAIAIPLTYLIITIVRKFKKKQYSWFIGCKGISIFIVDFILLIVLPVALISVLFTFDANIKYAIETTKDFKFVLFTFSSVLIFTFIIKLIYVIVFNRYFKSLGSDATKKIDAVDLNYLGFGNDN